jgi:hypothetical protein
MIDTRAIGQELQDQLQAAARKGQQRVTTTARTVVATARMIRPQLPNLPRPTPATLRSAFPTPEQIRSAIPTPEQIRSAIPTPEQIRSALPTPEQIRSAIAASGQLIERAPAFAAKLAGADRLTAGTHELVGQMRAIQNRVLDQVRDLTAPLAKRAGLAERRPARRHPVHTGPMQLASENGDGQAATAEQTAKHTSEHTSEHTAEPTATKPAAKTAAKTAKASRPSPASRTNKGASRPKPTSK